MLCIRDLWCRRAMHNAQSHCPQRHVRLNAEPDCPQGKGRHCANSAHIAAGRAVMVWTDVGSQFNVPRSCSHPELKRGLAAPSTLLRLLRRNWAHERRRWRDDLASMQQANANWQRQLCEERSDLDRLQGETQRAARVLQHEDVKSTSCRKIASGGPMRRRNCCSQRRG